MRGLVGTLRTPKGGLGNRVMSFLSVRHVASALNTRYFSVNVLDRHRVEGIHTKPFLPLALLNMKVTSPRDLLHLDAIDLLDERIQRGQSLVFRKPLLGEVFARYAPLSTAKMPLLRMQPCRIHRSRGDEIPTVALHFRGGDFAQWNPEAVLAEAYYQDAIDLLIARHAELRFRIFTDDKSHLAIPGVSKRLLQSGLLVDSEACGRPMECDYAAIANSSVIVASPSTFAITAAMFGSASVIHSEKWIRACEDKGELFWKMVKERSLPGLSDSEIV